MSKKNQLYEVEIKSQALLREGKKSFVTYFKGGDYETIVSNCRILYPQYTNPEDKPNVDITPISLGEYRTRAKTNLIKKKGLMLEGKGDISEIMGDKGSSTEIDVC